MTTSFEAVYEGGVLRPLRPVDLPEGTELQVTIRPNTTSGKAIAAALAQIASRAPNLPDDGICALERRGGEDGATTTSRRP